MWQHLASALAAGLCAGPACALHCGFLQGAFVWRLAPETRRRSVALGAWLLAGRLAAYLAIGLVLGAIAGTGVPMPTNEVLATVAGILLLAAAVAPAKHGSAPCGCPSRLAGAAIGGALLMGIVTGLKPCPPMLASAVLALRSGGVLPAVLTLAAFFVGSSLFLLPFLFGSALLPATALNRLRAAGRPAVLLAAAVAFATAFRGWARGTDSAPVPLAPARAGAQADASHAPAPGGTVAVPPRAGPEVKPLYRKKQLKDRITAAMITRWQLSLREAAYYRAEKDGTVSCLLCPRGCRLEEGQRGMCRVRANIDGRMRSLTYGRPVALHADPVEKKPLFHVLPGSTALSIATVGCNSGCVFCQNFELSQASPEDVRAAEISPAQIVEGTLARGCDGIAYTYTEPTVFYEYMLETARLAREKGLRNYWITCGQIREEPLRELAPYLDAANVDLKGFSDEFYVEYCDFRLEPVLRTLRVLKEEGVFVEITNLVIPGANDDSDMIRDMCRWIEAELGPETPLHFSRFHPAYKLTRRPPTPIRTLERARRIAREEGLRFVYIGNARTEDGAHTVCPQCGTVIVERTGFVVTANRMENGRCASCDRPVPGRWEGKSPDREDR